MSSYLHGLLNQHEPLEAHEIEDLKNWLDALEEDCSTFRATHEDLRRMQSIRQKLDAQNVSAR